MVKNQPPKFKDSIKKLSRVPVDCPRVVQVYNRHMGGVDLLDSIIGRYRITMRSKKWYFKLFYHFLDMSLVNAWLLYRRARENKNTIPLAKFRQEVAVALCQTGTLSTPTRGRKRKVDEIVNNYKKRGKLNLVQYIIYCICNMYIYILRLINYRCPNTCTIQRC